MSKPIRVLFATFALLLAVELALDAWFASPPPFEGIPARDPLCFALGTSRTMAGLDPAAMEAAMRENGIAEPWVSNIAQDGITTFGMFDLYMNEIRPLATEAKRRGVLAIEVRPSGLNDNYATPEENDKWTRGEYRSLVATVRSQGVLVDQFSKLQLEAASKTLFALTALGSGRETMRRIERRLVAGGVPTWASGAKGFRPYLEGRRDDLSEATWRQHYEKTLLAGFSFGERQFLMLKLLATQARKDGFDVVLYIMPVTDIQKSFWKPQKLLPWVISQVSEWAKKENIPLYDFDSGNSLTHDDFFDTHHLRPESAPRFSREFALRVFAPRAR